MKKKMGMHVKKKEVSIIKEGFIEFWKKKEIDIKKCRFPSFSKFKEGLKKKESKKKEKVPPLCEHCDHKIANT